MKDLDWNDLRYILYLSRTGRIASTAKMLTHSNTAFRMAALETSLSEPTVVSGCSLRLVVTGWSPDFDIR